MEVTILIDLASKFIDKFCGLLTIKLHSERRKGSVISNRLLTLLG